MEAFWQRMKVMTMGWKKVWSDEGRRDWEEGWFLDGKLAEVRNTEAGMVMKTGPVEKGDASHGVLWTRGSFRGDVRVAWDFTRVDAAMEHVSVCIVYVQATGVGEGAYGADIFSWRELREVPTMSLYFQHMNCYHVSYACTGGKDFNYVRARRYPTKGAFDKDTRIEPSYDGVDLFKPGETWRMELEKVGVKLSLRATKGKESHEWVWDAKNFAEVKEGRIGFRQMLGRESVYGNVEVWGRE